MNDLKNFQNLYGAKQAFHNHPDMTYPKILHKKFIQLGRERNRLTYKLLELLPEIFDRKIYKDYGCDTIEEYAGKFAGLSKSVVQKRLRLEKHLKDKPHLKRTLAKQGVHKVNMVARLATPETEEAWADKVENMSKASLFELAKEVRRNEKIRKNKEMMGKWISSMNKEMEGRNIIEDECGKSSDNISFKCCAVPQKIKIDLDEEMQFLFLKLKKKLGKNLSNKECMRKILEKLAETELTGIDSIGVNVIKKQSINKVKSVPGNTFQRKEVKKRTYIKIAKRREELTKTNGKCAYNGCGKPAEIFHHKERFSESKNHNSIVPICKEHHEFMHNGVIVNERSGANMWKINVHSRKINKADLLYQKYRQTTAL